MVSQYRGDEEGTKVYGGGPPPEVPGVRVIGLEARGEQAGGDFEKDIEEMTRVVVEEHGRAPFDVVHAQYGYPTGLAALVASRRIGVPNLVSIQGGDGHWVGSCCGTHKRAMLAVLGHAGALLIGSRSFADEVTENHGTPSDRFTIIPGAVNTERFYPAGEDSRGDRGHTAPALPRPRRRPQGRPRPARRFCRPLRTSAGPAHRPQVSALTQRTPPNAPGTSASTDKVEFSGYADYAATPEVYRRADLFVSPTYAEGFSNTILEAMATRLPIVSTRAVGVVDCLRHKENALLHEPGDVPGLTAALVPDA